MLEKRIADKIRQVRTTRGLTLAQLAGLTSLSKGLLSRIENNRTSPPIGTLSKISQGLGVHISFFFEEDAADRKGYAVTRRNRRKQVIRKGSKIGFTYYSLTNLGSEHLIEPFLVRYPVIKKEPNVLFDHPGEEFVYVLKGQIEFICGKDRVRLGPGDSVHFDPSIPHRGQNAGEGESECLVVVVEKWS
jgi:transcriptional regulator with XRE-family HTH domain